MATNAPYRRVTTPDEIARVQTYLSGHFPYSLKLYCTIRSWQQQAATATTEADLIEPAFPSLFVGCNYDGQSSTQGDEFDVVVLRYGRPFPSPACSDRADATAGDSRPANDLYIGFWAPDDASDRLYQVLAALLPPPLPFQSFANPTHFNGVLERLAADRGGRVSYNPHQQWIKPDARYEQTQFIEPSAFVSRSAPTPSPTSAPSSSADVVISPSNEAGATTPSSSPSDVTVTVAPLEVSHAALVEQWWPYSSAGTAKVMPHIIENIPTRCVYVDGEPACWALAQNYGGIGMLHTLDPYRGKGYARKCIDSLCAALVELDQTPFCFIGTANVASQKVFHSLGFKPTNFIDWVIVTV